jgi:hypothetical protein
MKAEDFVILGKKIFIGLLITAVPLIIFLVTLTLVKRIL